MKNIFLLCVVVSVCGCLKIQKKSDHADQPQIQNIPVVVEEEAPKPELVTYVFDETMSLAQDTLIVADEVYLKSNTKIYTNQFNLDIKATSIFIDRGVFIQTFAESNSVAPADTPGVNGGVVRIVANDIHGNLQVFMNGQSGGEGRLGWSALAADAFWPGREACYPGSGKKSGVSGSFFMEAGQSQDFSLSTSMKIAEGGAIGPVVTKGYVELMNLVYQYTIQLKYPCDVIPSRGDAGIQGQICLKLSASDLAQCERF